jgi:ornithine cyclodeaminase/alanine dehydrogenase-like protein (mu-crystallin family)
LEVTLLINDEEVRKVLTLDDFIDGVEDAYRQYGRGLAGGNHLRYGAPLLHRRELVVEGKELPHGDRRSKTISQNMAYLEERRMAVLQHSFNLGDRKEIMWHLIDVTNGETLAIVKSMYVSRMRAAADGAVAAKYLSRKDSRVAGIIGTGRQGRGQLRLLCKVRDIEKASAHSGRRRDDKYADEMSKELGIDVVACDEPEEVVRKADILVTVTRATAPIVKGVWIDQGLHINSIGADCPLKAELDVSALKKADKLVIDYELALDTADIRVPIEQGILRKEDIFGNIGEVVAGVKPGRENSEEITIYRSTGMAIAYVNIIAKAFENAKKMGLGTETHSHL